MRPHSNASHLSIEILDLLAWDLLVRPSLNGYQAMFSTQLIVRPSKCRLRPDALFLPSLPRKPRATPVSTPAEEENPFKAARKGRRRPIPTFFDHLSPGLGSCSLNRHRCRCGVLERGSTGAWYLNNVACSAGASAAHPEGSRRQTSRWRSPHTV
jgi:hypothetical protein